MNALPAMLFAFLQQEFNPQDVSWWLPHSPALRGLIWTVVLALNLAVLLYFLHKMLFRGKNWSLPGALRERGRSIEQQMRDAETAHQQSLARLAAIEARVAGLPAELAALEAEAKAEAEREAARLLEESRREAERVVSLGKSEIEAAAKLAQRELRGLAASLALDLAARRLRERLTPDLDHAVVRAAVNDLASADLRSGRVN